MIPQEHGELEDTGSEWEASELSQKVENTIAARYARQFSSQSVADTDRAAEAKSSDKATPRGRGKEKPRVTKASL